MTLIACAPAMENRSACLATLSSSAGVYQFLDQHQKLLYVGKARNLKKRVSSYFRKTGLMLKTTALMQQVHFLEILVTPTENEALILENNLIKKYKPRYNILFRDDKSYPYIALSNHLDYPQLTFYRGKRQPGWRYFGPYPGSYAARETLHLLQKIFHLRPCEESFFRNRSRPCLQYQIKRCSAPCVALISPEHYQRDVQHAMLFLQGKSQTIIEELANQMETAANQLEFEKAALLRNQIAYLRQAQQQSAVDVDAGDVDILALVIKQQRACVQVMMVRNGHLLGGKAFFPQILPDVTAQEILSAFIAQYYLRDDHAVRKIPKLILLSHKLVEQSWLAATLSQQEDYRIRLNTPQKGKRMRWLRLALYNAEQALQQRLSIVTFKQRLEALQQKLDLPALPTRLECFDVSHSQGEATVAACVVFNEQGPCKQEYRRFNIRAITPGDDYGALRQALSRRYAKINSERNILPEVLVIDGGRVQLKQAEAVLKELNLNGIVLLAIAKGITRKPGLETVFLSARAEPLAFAADSLELRLLQQIRDEAHRFAITGHRGQRARIRQKSLLETIPGIGAKRRRELLRLFGGLQELRCASIEQIAQTPGISKLLAEQIYHVLQQ